MLFGVAGPMRSKVCTQPALRKRDESLHAPSWKIFEAQASHMNVDRRVVSDLLDVHTLLSNQLGTKNIIVNLSEGVFMAGRVGNGD